MVTGIIAAYDGGKLICGYGKTAGAVVKAWLVKMWGVSAATSGMVCNAPTASLAGAITGYVTMAIKSNADLASTPANCVLSKDAYTQFIYTEQPLTGNAANTYTKLKAVTGDAAPSASTAISYYINAGNRSSVYLSVAEELDTTSKTADTVQLDPTSTTIAAEVWYIAVGGLAHGFTFGMGAWYTLIKQLDASGVMANYCGQVYEKSSPGRHWVSEAAVGRLSQNVEGRYRSSPTGSAETGITTSTKGAFGDQQTNSCYTAAGFNTAGGSTTATPPLDETKYFVGGQTLSGVGCLAIAADGYALSGILVFYKLGDDVTLAPSGEAAATGDETNVRPLVNTKGK